MSVQVEDPRGGQMAREREREGETRRALFFFHAVTCLFVAVSRVEEIDACVGRRSSIKSRGKTMFIYMISFHTEVGLPEKSTVYLRSGRMH